MRLNETNQTFWFSHDFYGIHLDVEAARHEWEIDKELSEHFTISTVVANDAENGVNFLDMPAILRYEPDPFFGAKIMLPVYGTLNELLQQLAKADWIANQKENAFITEE